MILDGAVADGHGSMAIYIACVCVCVCGGGGGGGGHKLLSTALWGSWPLWPPHFYAYVKENSTLLLHCTARKKRG